MNASCTHAHASTGHRPRGLKGGVEGGGGKTHSPELMQDPEGRGIPS